MNTNRLQKGFSLIELMIVVAIIGVLAAIAVPQYNNYIARGQVSEAMTLLAAAKTAIEEESVSNNTWAMGNAAGGICPATAIPAGLVSLYGIQNMGQYVACLSYLNGMAGAAGVGMGPTGNLTATFAVAGVNAQLSMTVLSFTRQADGTWTCDRMTATMARMALMIPGVTTVPDNLLPNSCI